MYSTRPLTSPGAASAAAAVTEQVTKLQTVIDSAADVNLKIEDGLRRQHEFIRTASQKTLAEVHSMGQTLAGQVNSLSTATERARGMSAAELARASGIPAPNISEILSLKLDRYSIDRLNKVLAVFGKRVAVSYRLENVAVE